MRGVFKQRLPAAEIGHDVEKGFAGGRLELFRLDHVGRSCQHRNVAGPGIVVQCADRCVAETALRRVDDALEGEIVRWLADEAEVSHRIADFEAFIEARAADDAIVEAERDEAVFEFAHLEGGADQDRHVVELVLAALKLFDFLADGAGFLFRVPGGVHLHLVMVRIEAFGEERLAEPAFIMGDQMSGRTEDMAGGAVVALQLDDLGAGEILFEAEDVVDFGAAPAVDRLVVVADAADIDLSTLAPWSSSGALRQQPQPHVLCRIGVLVLVHQNVAEAFVIFLQHVRMFLEHADRMQEEVAEIAGIQRQQAVLIGDVEFTPLAVGESARVAFGNLGGVQTLVLPAVDHGGELLGGPALVVDAFGLQDLLDQADHVICIENCEIRFQSDEFRVPAQHLDADGVERAEPGHALDRAADQHADALLHLARGLVGEGHGQDLARIGATGRENVGDAGG